MAGIDDTTGEAKDTGAGSVPPGCSSSRQDIADKATQLEIISQFASSFLDLTTRDELVWHVAREVVSELGFVDCVIYLLDSGRNVLVQSAAIGEKNPNQEHIVNRLEILVGSGITGLVAETKRPMIIADGQADRRFIADINDARSELCVPLIYGGDILGVIDCENPETDFFTKDHLDVLTTIASMLSARLAQCFAIEEHETTIGRLSESEKIQSALLRVASLTLREDAPSDLFSDIHETVSSLMDADNFFFASCNFREDSLSFPFLVEGGIRQGQLVRHEGLALSDTMSAYALRTNAPLLLSADQADRHVEEGDFKYIGQKPTSAILVPFDLDAETRGVAAVQCYDGSVVYTERDLELLTHIARQFGQAIRHRNARQSLRESEERFSLAVEGSQDGLWDWDIAADTRWYSEKWCAIIGYSQSEIGSTYQDLIELIHPDDLDSMLAASDKHLADHIPYVNEYRMRHKDGHYVPVGMRGQAVWDEQGKPLRMAGSTTDLTDQKATEERLRQAQKMEAVGQLTGGVAHDFNNLLAVIMGNIGLALRRMDDDSPNGALLGSAIRACKRGAELVERLLSFSRKQALSPASLYLQDIVEGMHELLGRSMGETIEIVNHIGADIWPVMADQGGLENALLNLVVNGRDAMPGGGLIMLHASNVSVDDGDAECDMVRFMVSDTGEGMSEDVLEHALEPFFTTKEVGAGTGLGLAMVFGFVKQSDGDISIKSKEGGGTIVEMLLPRASDVAEENDVSDQPVPKALPGRLRILVVEDDPDLRIISTLTLEGLGHECIGAADGMEALGLLEGGEQFDLLFTDVVLPKGLSGVDLARRARESHNDLPVLFTSGYPREELQKLEGGEIEMELLPKPYTLEELQDKLDAALKR